MFLTGSHFFGPSFPFSNINTQIVGKNGQVFDVLASGVSYTSITGHEKYQYKVDTGDLELPENTFPDAIPYPAFKYRIKEITITLKGPLGDGNQETMHTQKYTLKAWRALTPSGI